MDVDYAVHACHVYSMFTQRIMTDDPSTSSGVYRDDCMSYFEWLCGLVS